ncbi:MAG: ATP-dependent RNA helicase HrpA [Actinomycetales bacterium]|nr:ATP-dependent RNA helicase HrpA [Actinomycetales bacterium]
MSLALPAITYPPELPVSAARDELARALAAHQVVVVAGATGSGKTTQLPKILLELGRERIGHTQPRRIAARSVAERIAHELGVELGGLVGYQVRFDDRAGRDTAVKVMTDGVLLAEIHRDPELRRYDAIIIDEAHERSLTIDFLLGYLKRLLPRRPDLKLVITSATIDPESFARHFADAEGEPAPVVEVSGRTYPVEIRYRPLVGADRLAAEVAEAGLDPAELDPADWEQLDDEGASADDRDVLEGIRAALDELRREEPGDVLVFLSGENEIRDAQEALTGRPGTEVLPLYGRLSAADQHRVFDTARAPGVRTRVVLATNVAETSLTVPGIRYVIDAGTARISRYAPRAKVQRLPIEPVSQASAAQRAGRAGRTSPGIAIRLYSEADFARRSAFTDPEILRTDLAAVLLQMLALGLGELAEFPFLQPPDSRGVRDANEVLLELGAIAVDPVSGGTRITRIGRDLARLPVDPRFGRMLIEAGRRGVARAVAVIVAGLSVQDPRERPLERRPEADAAHARFADPRSDLITLWNLWRHLGQRRAALSGTAFRRELKREYLHYLRVREWQDLVRQLERAGREVRLDLRAPAGGDADGPAPDADGPAPDADAIHRAVLSGLLSRIGVVDEQSAARARDARQAGRDAGREARAAARRGAEYLGVRGRRFRIFPGSALAKKPPAAVMAAELVETSELFARTVAAIDPAWAEELAGDLAQRSHSNPRWDARQGRAVIDERVVLWGVPLVPRRRIALARLDAAHARELLIREGLLGIGRDDERDERLARSGAGGSTGWPHDTSRDRLFEFLRENARLRRELAAVEERERRRDLLADDETMVAFYEARIPADVTDTRAFERWWRSARAETPRLLTATREDLLGAEESVADAHDFPTEWVQGAARLRLAYRFEPGADDDGVTVEIPLELLPTIEPRGFDWLVPGLREELVTALLRALPKAIRRHVVPAGEWARRLLPELPERADTPIGEVLGRAIRAGAQVPVAPDDFEWERVPPHLRMTFAAVDARGRRVGTSRDLGALQERFAERARRTVAQVVAADPQPTIERAGITSWDLGDLSEAVESRGVRGYPALVDEGRSVALRVLTDPDEARRRHVRGVLRLLALTVPSPAGYVRAHLTDAEKLALAASPYASVNELFDDALLAALAAGAAGRAPRDAAGFDALRAEVSAGLVDGAFDIVRQASGILRRAREVDRAIAALPALTLMPALTDARAQLAGLVPRGFLGAARPRDLRRLPVYLDALQHRLAKLPENPGRDRTAMTEVEQALALYRDAGGAIPVDPAAPERLVEARWMLEELRVSLFAQQLGAAGPVSVPRIRKALAGG